jgi:nitrate/nitrite transporter NarK
MGPSRYESVGTISSILEIKNQINIFNLWYDTLCIYSSFKISFICSVLTLNLANKQLWNRLKDFHIVRAVYI